MPTYEKTRFWTTHNSYSGGERGTLIRQLEGRVRWLEMDVHDNGYEEIGDYRLGHWKPGHEVLLGDGAPAARNPATLLLRAWLRLLADWSARRAADHAPITLVLDLKSDLTDNDGGGDLEDLNQTLEGAFGTRLYGRDDYDAAGGWPEVERLQGRFVVVLSGDSKTRYAYRSCSGRQPALAVNAAGDVVLAYRSDGGDLRAWSGAVDPDDGRVTWYRKGTYALSPYTVSEPSVAINDDRWVVSVYRVGPQFGQPGPALLESRLGRLQDDEPGKVDRRIKWFSTQTLGAGMNPSLEIAGDAVHLIHLGDDGQRRRERRGTIDRQKRRIAWTKPRDTPSPLLPRDAAVWQGRRLRGRADEAGVVLFSVDDAALPVRFRQRAFVERQPGDDPTSVGDALFFAAPADRRADIAAARNRGLAARGWGFGEADRTAPPSPPQENAAATDTPFQQWYTDYMEAGGQAQS